MQTTKLRLGTRGSALARWQADWVAAQLQTLGVDVELILISTQGDVREGPIGQLGGQGVFTKEIQRALLEQQVDLAVHSLKDLPTEPVPGLRLGAVPPREDNRDVLVSRDNVLLADLPVGSRFGTGSLRRRTQLLHQRSDLTMLDIRGNVETRLAKLDAGDYDAIALAAAGLRRLQLAHRITQSFEQADVLPAVGQGALGLEVRADDQETIDRVAPLNDPATLAAVTAERAMLAALRGGCLAPVGGWARVDQDKLRLDGVVLSLDGAQRLHVAQVGDVQAAQSLGEQVAAQLLESGAAELIEQSRGS